MSNVYLKEENFLFSWTGSAHCNDADDNVEAVVNDNNYVDDENDDASKYSG